MVYPPGDCLHANTRHFAQCSKKVITPVFMTSMAGKHFLNFISSALGNILPCFSKVSLFINKHCCRMQQTAIYALIIVVVIFIVLLSGCILSHFLQLFVNVLLVVLTGCVASASKQRCVCELCILCKRLFTLSQNRQLYKKKTVAPRRGLQPTTTPDRQPRCFL